MSIPTEHDEQKALFTWAFNQRRKYPELSLMFAIPNGGHRHKATAAKLHAEGVKSGVPDICLPVARKDHHGLFIEMKRTKGGVVAPIQKAWLGQLQKQGYSVAVCKGWVQAKDVLVEYLEKA
jgi:hypothetical protein